MAAIALDEKSSESRARTGPPPEELDSYEVMQELDADKEPVELDAMPSRPPSEPKYCCIW
jgi:hypothetical protein